MHVHRVALSSGLAGGAQEQRPTSLQDTRSLFYTVSSQAEQNPEVLGRSICSKDPLLALFGRKPSVGLQ
jgi:hypothetical protein